MCGITRRPVFTVTCYKGLQVDSIQLLYCVCDTPYDMQMYIISTTGVYVIVNVSEFWIGGRGFYKQADVLTNTKWIPSLIFFVVLFVTGACPGERGHDLQGG